MWVTCFFVKKNTIPRESVTVKSVFGISQATDKSDTRKKAVFLPEPEITSIKGAYRTIGYATFLTRYLFGR